jgi:hypothetical protein
MKFPKKQFSQHLIIGAFCAFAATLSYAQGVAHDRVIQDFTRTNRLTGTPPANLSNTVIPNQTQSFGGMYYWVYGCVGANPFTGSCSCPSGYTAQLFSAVNGEGGRDIYVCNKV